MISGSSYGCLWFLRWVPRLLGLVALLLVLALVQLHFGLFGEERMAELLASIRQASREFFRSLSWIDLLVGPALITGS